MMRQLIPGPYILYYYVASFRNASLALTDASIHWQDIGTIQPLEFGFGEESLPQLIKQGNPIYNTAEVIS